MQVFKANKFPKEAKPITAKTCTYRLPIRSVISVFDDIRTGRYFGMDHHTDDDAVFCRIHRRCHCAVVLESTVMMAEDLVNLDSCCCLSQHYFFYCSFQIKHQRKRSLTFCLLFFQQNVRQFN